MTELSKGRRPSFCTRFWLFRRAAVDRARTGGAALLFGTLIAEPREHPNAPGLKIKNVARADLGSDGWDCSLSSLQPKDDLRSILNHCVVHAIRLVFAGSDG